MKDIKIRGLDEETILKIDRMKGTQSRNEFLKKYIEDIANKKEIQEIETKYDELLKLVLKSIDDNTKVLKQLVDFDMEDENEKY